MGDWAQKYRNTSDFTLKEEGAENLICSLHQALSYYMIKAVTIFSGPMAAIFNYTVQHFII